MNKWIMCLAICGCILTFSTLALGEPTVTANGSVEVIGSTGSKGMSSIYSTTDLDLDIDFSDYISGVIETRGVSSNSNSSINVRQGYFVTGRLNGTNHTGMTRDTFSSAKELFKNTGVMDKAFVNAGLFPLPEKKSSLFVEKDNQKDESLHVLILADLKSRFLLTPQTKQPLPDNPVRLSKSN